MASRSALLALLLASLFITFTLSAQAPQELAARIRRVETNLMPYVPVTGLESWNIEERMRYHRVPGMSIAVIRNYQIDWAKSYGLADTTTRKPVTNETMFSAGSISKLVTAMAALKLVDAGKMALDAPINQYLTSWKLSENDYTRKTPVTLRMLLSHRGGTSQSAYFGFTPDKSPLPSVVDILSGKPGVESRAVVVNSEPGKEFRYSGGGYLVIQMAMMDVTKQDFAPFTNQTLFGPLGLSHTTFTQPLPKALASKATWAYSENSWFKGMPYVYPQQAAAGLYSTPTDLARLLINLQNSYRGKGGLLSPASARAMMTPLAGVSDGYYKEQIGLGVFLLQQTTNQDEWGLYFDHSGVNAGFLAYATASVVGGNGVVVMMNNNNGASELGKEIRRAVAQVYGWPGFLPQPVKLLPLPDSLLNAYVGRYQRGADEVVTFRREKNYLIETINNGSGIYCIPLSRDTVAFTDYTLKGFFCRNASGRVDSIRVEGQASAMPRLAEGVYLPNELLRMGRVTDAVAGYRTLKLSVYQLTYLAYELTNNRPANLNAAEGILGLATEQYPKESIVYARWGDLHQKRGDKTKAIAAYQTALQFDPADKESTEKLTALLAR